MLKAQVEERLTFYESGTAPRKNTVCMQKVIQDITAEKEAAPAEAEPQPMEEEPPVETPSIAFQSHKNNVCREEEGCSQVCSKNS